MFALLSLFKRGCVHVVGITAYRTAQVGDIVLECKRDDLSFLEDTLLHKDNHVVLCFQVLWGENGWVSGMYYAFLHDSYCIIGKQLIVQDF